MRMSLLILFALALGAWPLQAADKLLVGLYLAEKHPADPQASPNLAERLRHVFGYPFYRLIKADSINLADREHWVVSRKDFYLHLRPLKRRGTEAPRVKYGIYKDGFLIADGTYRVDDETPLFITGPDLKDGRLIFVLESK